MSQAFDDCARAICGMLVNDLHVELKPDEIALDAGLKTVVGLDDAGIAQLRHLCEQKFHVQISDAAVNQENFSTVRRLAYLVLGLKRVPGDKT
jgi:acyl carrier protein